MQLKQGIYVITNLREQTKHCGHKQEERFKNDKGYYCCPDTEKPFGNYSFGCSKQFTVFRKWQSHQHTIHLPADADIVEKVVLTHQKIKALQVKLQEEIYFKCDYLLWSQWIEAPKVWEILIRKKFIIFYLDYLKSFLL